MRPRESGRIMTTAEDRAGRPPDIEEPRGLKSEAARVQGFFEELVKRFHLTEPEARRYIDEFERS